MVQFRMKKYTSCWKAVALPHSGGKVPAKPGLPSSSLTNEGSEPLCPQADGNVPVRLVSKTKSNAREGRAPSSAHAIGNGPVKQLVRPVFAW